MRFKMRFD